MLGAAAVCGGIALSAVRSERRGVAAQIGEPVQAVVAARAIPAGARLTRVSTRTHLAERRVPRRFVPPGTLVSAAEAAGRSTSARLEAGDYLTRGVLSPAGTGPRRRRTRQVEVRVAGSDAIATHLRAGTAVDVLVTTDGVRRAPRTYVAVQGADLTRFETRTVNGGQSTSGVASLRVSLREAVLLTAAQSFARELRLVPRPPGERTQRRLQVREGDL
jgi:pilus assembly protein CpaB